MWTNAGRASTGGDQQEATAKTYGQGVFEEEGT